MRSVKGKVLLPALGAAMWGMAAIAQADVTVEEGSSIVVFPKVIADGTRDTIIQITNISNDLVFARCFYVNAQLTDPRFPEHPILNPPLWLETDFNIRLTRQQPTHWVASQGRPVDPFDVCQLRPTYAGDSAGASTKDENINFACVEPIKTLSGGAADNGYGYGINLDGLGIDPGAVPPLPADFVGELKCVEVDASGTPIGGNHLKGEASIVDDAAAMMPGGADVSKYNAAGILGTDLAGATGNDLQLNNPQSGEPPGQYDACPAETILNHFADGTEDPVIVDSGLGRRCTVDPGITCWEDDDCSGDTGPCVKGGVCSDNDDPCVNAGDCNPGATCLLAGIETELTIVPCSQDFENQRPARVTIQFKIYNEYEVPFSTSTSVVCWKNIRLADIGNTNVFDRAVLGSDVAQTFMTPADIGDGGFLTVAEVFRRNAIGAQARAAMNVHTRGDRFLGDQGQEFDRIVLPDLN